MSRAGTGGRGRTRRGGGWRCRRRRKEEEESGRKEKERGPIHDCAGKWVKRQVERAANLNHRQFCAVQFDST